MQNVLFIISGPSGVGKGTLVKLLVKEDPSLALSISCTTRQPRKGERDGVEYFFLTEEEFTRKIEEGEFLEYNTHFEHSYGTPRSFVEAQMQTHSVILEIEVEGGIKAAKAMQGACPIVRIMIVPPDMDALESRLKHRGAESEEQLKERRDRVAYELSKQGEYDYVVVNDDLERAKQELASIIEQEKNKLR